MTGNKALLASFKENDVHAVIFRDQNSSSNRGYGTIGNGAVFFSNVAFVEGLKHNLLSISQLYDKRHQVIFLNNQYQVRDLETNLLKLSGYRDGNDYVVNLAKLSPTEAACFLAKAYVDVS